MLFPFSFKYKGKIQGIAPELTLSSLQIVASAVLIVAVLGRGGNRWLILPWCVTTTILICEYSDMEAPFSLVIFLFHLIFKMYLMIVGKEIVYVLNDVIILFLNGSINSARMNINSSFFIIINFVELGRSNSQIVSLFRNQNLIFFCNCLTMACWW